MGRPRGRPRGSTNANKSANSASIAAFLPTMKFKEASRLADKNARTIRKISQLMEVLNLPGSSKIDKEGVIEAHIAKLRNRVQRRLVKLAKWSDCPAGVRMAEFNSYGAPRYTFVGQMRVRQMPYSKAIPPAPVPVGSVKMPQVYLRSGAAAVSNGEAVATNQTDTAATAAAGSSSGYRTSCRADEGDRNTIVAATHEATSAADRPGEAMEMSSRQDDMGSTNI